MNTRYMLLPAREFTNARLLQIPEDMEEHEAFRCVTGVIGQVQGSADDWAWDDVLDALEVHGFTNIDIMLGPELD